MSKTIDKKKAGLYSKFIVRRSDGSDSPAGKHHGCRYFVLDLDHDPFSRAAIDAYADACAGEYPNLAEDLRGRRFLKISESNSPDLQPRAEESE